MARVEASNCPECGAPLEVHPETKEARCEYCGTLAQVHQDKPQVLAQLVVSRPEAMVPLIVAAIILVAIIVVAIGSAVTRPVRPPRAEPLSPSNIPEPPAVPEIAPSQAPVPERLSFNDHPMLADADGDGVPDVIGHAEWDATDYLAAFEGATGKLLWRTSAPKDAFKGERAIVGDLFLVVDDLGKVQATRIANGVPAWAGILTDKARRFCGDANSAIIEAHDGTFTRFDLATGRKSAVDLGGKKQPSCAPVYQTRDNRSPKYAIVGWAEFAAHKLPEIHSVPGLSALRALVPTTSGLSFMLGSRDKGTQVAMVAAVENGKVLWKDLVPGVDPLTTESNVTTIMAASDGASVAIPYGMSGHTNGVRMACFEGRSGKRLWDVQIHNHNDVQAGITIEAGRVYYASWTSLYVLSLKDGKMLYQLGYDF
jgi:hypothetical protein